MMPILRERTRFVAWLEPAIDRANGARLFAAGDHGSGIAALTRAAAAYERLGMRDELARTRQLLG